jgi:hypothetical protein
MPLGAFSASSISPANPSELRPSRSNGFPAPSDSTLASLGKNDFADLCAVERRLFSVGL